LALLGSKVKRQTPPRLRRYIEEIKSALWTTKLGYVQTELNFADYLSRLPKEVLEGPELQKTEKLCRTLEWAKKADFHRFKGEM
jgi:hypothetical protein